MLTEEMMVQLREAVGRGADFLDNRDASWPSKVDLGVLDTENPRWCVLGQIYHTEASIHDPLWTLDVLPHFIARLATDDYHGDWDTRHGFNVGWLDEEDDLYDDDTAEVMYGYLSAVWREEIRNRRNRTAAQILSA